MPGFSLRKKPASEDQDAPEPGLTSERAARFRDLDEEIRRRDGELRATKDAEHAGTAPSGPEKRGARTRSAETEEEALADPIAATIEDARKDLLKLAGRVEALESSVREVQQRNWEALQARDGALDERLEGLERRADDASSEAAKGQTEAGERLEQRLAELEKRVSKASKARTRSSERMEEFERRLDEIGRTESPLENRLADLERAMGGAVDARLAGLEKWADEAADEATKAEARTSARIEELARRVDTVDKLPERVEEVGKQIESARKTADDVRSLHEPLAVRLTELEALEREAANESRKLEQRVAETIERLTARTELVELIETLTTRVDALDHRLSEAERGSARPHEHPASPKPEAASSSWRSS